MSSAPEMSHTGEPAGLAEAPPRDLTPLVDGLRAVVGDKWVYTQEHQLRTYESDGLLQYHVIPAAAVLPGSGEEGELFRRVFGWSILLLLVMCVLVYLQSTAVLSWMVV